MTFPARAARWAAVGAAVMVTVATLSGCASSGSAAAGDVKVGLLLPENQTPRYEKFDKPSFEAALEKSCSDCTTLYANAGNDATKQQSQAESLMAQGAKVLVVYPVDSDAVSTIVSAANARDVKVIFYGRHGSGPAAYDAAYSSADIGTSNAELLKSAMEAKGHPSGKVVILAGDKTTADATPVVAAAKKVLAGYDIARTYWVKDWSATNAQTAMDQALTAVGKNDIVGVWAANDGIAGGAIASMQNAGLDGLPAVSGMDVDLTGVQRILAGTQAGSLSLSPITYAGEAARIAAEVAQGQTPKTDGTYDDGKGNKIPLITVPMPDPVTRNNIQSDVIDKSVYTYDEICTAQYQQECDALGLQPKS